MLCAFGATLKPAVITNELALIVVVFHRCNQPTDFHLSGACLYPLNLEESPSSAGRRPLQKLWRGSD